MARIILTVVCVWGVLYAMLSLWGIASDILTAQQVYLSGWMLQLTNEHRSGGSYSIEHDDLPLLFLPYFAVAGLLFLTVALCGWRWLRSPHRVRWFSGCAAVTFVLCFFGMISGFILFGLPLLVFVFLALTRERHENSGPSAAS
jgi:hypothetical protein